MLDKKRKIHFIGVCGVGMSGLALILKKLGHEVSGCDLMKSKYFENLKREGVEVFIGHDPSHLEGVEIVVYSSAISKDNPEILSAKENGLILLPRAQMLAEVMKSYPKSILVSGSHGKTTTTSMIAEVLMGLGVNPTVIVGGVINNIQANSLLGKGEFLVAEADESDGSFLFYNPFIEVITNIDKEHLDFYADFEAIKRAFASFIRKCHPEGKVILCWDDQGVREVVAELSGPFLFYGFTEGADLRGHILKEDPYPLVEVTFKGKKLGSFRLSVPGRHNAQNALAALAVVHTLGLSIDKALEILQKFNGVKRRIEFKGIYKGALLFDDYAHHPREIESVIQTLKGLYPEKKLFVVFQPHRYTRTRALWNEFLLVLKESELLLLTEIYPASENPLPGITGEAFYEAVREVRTGKRPTFFGETLEEVKNLLEKLASPDMVIVTMGAGNIYRVGEELLEGENKAYEVA
ncbi:MAG: UDP-N-acetylmuramate--L-alanine ligase [Caldimicrobium sp.]